MKTLVENIQSGADAKLSCAEAAQICKALSDEKRLQIVGLLTGGELCACRILEKFEITQPTLSHHMRVLSGCNLVNARKDGKWAHYSLNCETLTAFREFITTLNCNVFCKCGVQ